MTNVTCDGNKLIEAIGLGGVAAILDTMGIDLTDAAASLSASCEWRCGVEMVWWPIAGKQLNLTDCYAVRWTYTDEAGIDDVEMVLRVDDEQDAADLQGWLEEIAANCGSCDGQVRQIVLNP